MWPSHIHTHTLKYNPKRTDFIISKLTPLQRRKKIYTTKCKFTIIKLTLLNTLKPEYRRNLCSRDKTMPQLSRACLSRRQNIGVLPSRPAPDNGRLILFYFSFSVSQCLLCLFSLTSVDSAVSIMAWRRCRGLHDVIPEEEEKE